jgi:hypothetical protein|nr:MAG TPA: hypothetical protein [Caudoviricetes sp.]
MIVNVNVEILEQLMELPYEQGIQLLVGVLIIP